LISITSTATLSGALDVTLDPNYVPTPGDTLEILSAGSINGSFSTVNLPLANYPLSLNYTPTSVTITVLLPEPAGVGSAGIIALWLLQRRRRNGLGYFTR